MIFLELIFFLTLSFFSIYSLGGLGQLILNQKEEFFFENIFFGFIAATFIITLFHFFIKINLYIILLFSYLGFIMQLKNLNLIKITIKEIYFIL